MKTSLFILVSILSLSTFKASADAPVDNAPPGYVELNDQDVTPVPCDGVPATDLACFSSSAKFKKECEEDKKGTIVGFACAIAGGNFYTSACSAMCKLP